LKSCSEHQEDADIEKDYSTSVLRLSQRLQHKPEMHKMAVNVVVITRDILRVCRAEWIEEEKRNDIHLETCDEVKLV
jgi:hypothetical protein